MRLLSGTTQQPWSIAQKIATGMYLMNGGNELRYILLSVVWQSRIHYLVVDKESYKPHASLCLFAASLAGKLAANSVRKLPEKQHHFGVLGRGLWARSRSANFDLVNPLSAQTSWRTRSI